MRSQHGSSLPVYPNTVGRQRTSDNGWSYDRDQQVVYSNRTTTKGKKYTFDYVRARYSPDGAAQTAEPLPGDDPLQRSSPASRRTRSSTSWSPS